MTENSPTRISKEELRTLLRESIASRRQAIVYTLARIAFDALQSGELSIASSEQDWIPIGSLSQLRSLVGGRFQNLKERWIAAGFPLRSHRGDRAADAEIDSEGWNELAAWIFSQGYDARLAADGVEDKALFFVKKV